MRVQNRHSGNERDKSYEKCVYSGVVCKFLIQNLMQVERKRKTSAERKKERAFKKKLIEILILKERRDKRKSREETGRNYYLYLDRVQAFSFFHYNLIRSR